MKGLIFLLILVILLPVMAFGQELKSDTTHFWFRAYQTGQRQEPANGWIQFDSMAADTNYNLIIVGQSDLEVKTYKDLQKGIVLEEYLQYPTMLGYANMRTSAGYKRAGRGEKRAEVVQAAEDRGITLIRIPKLQTKMVVRPKLVKDYIGVTCQIMPMLQTSVDSNWYYLLGSSGVEYSSTDSAIVTVDRDGLLMLKEKGKAKIFVSYKTFFDSVFVEVLECSENFGVVPPPIITTPGQKTEITREGETTKEEESKKDTSAIRFFILSYSDNSGRIGGGCQLEFSSEFLVGGSTNGIEWQGKSREAYQVWLGYRIYKPISFLFGFEKEKENNGFWDKKGSFMGVQVQQKIARRFHMNAFVGVKKMYKYQHLQYGDWDFYNNSNDPTLIHIKRPIKIIEDRFWEHLVGVAQIEISYQIY